MLIMSLGDWSGRLQPKQPPSLLRIQLQNPNCIATCTIFQHSTYRILANSFWSVPVCVFIPTFFEEKWGYCNRLRPSVRLSPPKPLDRIQPNLVCELLTWMACARAHLFLAPPPGTLGRGQKVKFIQISISKSILKILTSNFAHVLSSDRSTTYWTGFCLRPPGVGWWGRGQGQKSKLTKHGHVAYQIEEDEE